MSKAKYLINRILKLDFKNMFAVAKAVSKKSHKPFIVIFTDMIKCGLKYQAGYYDYQEFEFYNISRDKRNTYLTRGKNNEIIKKYNDKSYFHIFNDKIEFNTVFSDYLKRGWINAGEASVDEFIKFTLEHPNIIAKIVDGEGGAGIEKYTIKDEAEARGVYERIKAENQLLVEEFVNQHPDLNVLYPNSVNTMRMFTIFKDGKGHFLQAVLKMGNGGVVDNFSSGGMYTFVEDDGTVEVPAIDKADKIYEKHPATGTSIIGFKVPMFKQAVELVESAAAVVPQVAYVGWDVAISDSGPVLIEGNCFPGVFQKRSSFSKNGEGIIPKYSKYIDI